MKYTFNVTTDNQIDFNRILQENAGAQAILLTSANALLLLSLGFLAQFNPDDYFQIMTETSSVLGPRWGLEHVGVKERNRELTFFARELHWRAGEPVTTTLAGYKAMPLRKSDIEIVVKQLQEARAALPLKRRVTVSKLF